MSHVLYRLRRRLRVVPCSRTYRVALSRRPLCPRAPRSRRRRGPRRRRSSTVASTTPPGRPPPRPRVHPALSRRGRAPQRADRAPRPLRRRRALRRHRLPPDDSPDLAPADAPRRAVPSDGVLIDIDSRHDGAAPSFPGQRRRRAARRHPFDDVASRATGTRSGRRRSPIRHTATPPSSASRCRSCGSRRAGAGLGLPGRAVHRPRQERSRLGRSGRAPPAIRVALRHARQPRRPRAAPPRRAAALRERRRRPPRRRAPTRTPYGGRRRGVGGPRRQVRPHQRADAGPDRQPRLRPGRGRPAVLNLSTYETFYPEKRPFFLEGMTRSPLRVPWSTPGASAGSPPVRGSRGETLVENPEPSPIWGAAKLSGRVGGTTLGLISAVTGAHRRSTSTGSASSALVDSLDGVQHPARQAPHRRQHRRRRAGDGGQPLRDPLPAGCPVRPQAPVGPTAAAPTTPTGQHRRPLARAARELRRRLASGGMTLRQGRPRLNPTASRSSPETLGRRVAVRRQGRRPPGCGASAVPVGASLEFNDLGYLERKNDYQVYPCSPTGP